MKHTDRHRGAAAAIVTLLLAGMLLLGAGAEEAAFELPWVRSGEELAAHRFLSAWAEVDYKAMADCVSRRWLESLAPGTDPRSALFGLIRGYHLTAWTPEEITVTVPDREAEVTVGIRVYAPSGAYQEWRLSLTVVRGEGEDRWYVDPSCLEGFWESGAMIGTPPTPAPGSAVTKTPEGAPTPRPIPTQPPTPPPPVVDEGTVLYYNPDGGTRYHADPRCPSVADRYLPLAGKFTYSHLWDARYRDLVPCFVCGAPPRIR